MFFSVTNLRDRVSQHVKYTNTLHELQALPLAVKLDLDISGVEAAVAKRAVYGN